MRRPAVILTLIALAAAPTPSPAAPRVKPAGHRAPQAVASRQYLYLERGVFELVTAPGRISDIVLEAGESLVETNPIAAGDTARWVIGDTSSGKGESRQVHVLVKPIQPGLSTNLIINTDRRTYHLQLRASTRAFLPQVTWRYPALVRAPGSPTASSAPVLVAAAPAPSPRPDTKRLNLRYRIKGASAWRPSRVYDDGVRTYVEFDPSIVVSDLPPLFIVGPDGKTSELINYQVANRRLVVDRLFDRAELRFGLKRWERRVRIERLPSRSEVAR